MAPHIHCHIHPHIGALWPAGDGMRAPRVLAPLSQRAAIHHLCHKQVVLALAAQGIVAALGDRAAALAAAGQRSACALPPALAAAGDSSKAALARHRVVSKSWACAYEQVESAYFRALATRWPYRVNTRGLK